MPLSRDELDKEYRILLRTVARLKKQNGQLRDLVLRVKGRSMSSAQMIDLELEAIARDDERHAIEADIHRMDAPNIQPNDRCRSSTS